MSDMKILLMIILGDWNHEFDVTICIRIEKLVLLDKNTHVLHFMHKFFPCLRIFAHHIAI